MGLVATSEWKVGTEKTCVKSKILYQWVHYGIDLWSVANAESSKSMFNI